MIFTIATIRCSATTNCPGTFFRGKPNKRWKAYVDFRNIGDKQYAAASNTAYDLKGVGSPNFYVDDGFAVYSGVSFRL